MRKFNKREKEIIKNLVDYYKNRDNLCTVAVFLTERVVVENYKIAIREDGQYIIYAKKDHQKEALYKVVEIINLFRYLIDEHLIYLMPGNIHEFFFIGEKNEIVKNNNDFSKAVLFANEDYINRQDNCWYDRNNQLKYVCFSFTEDQFPIKDFISSVPVISPELELLVNDNFKTLGEKTLCVTRITALISFFGLLIALLSTNMCSTKINKEQHKENIKSMQAIEQEVSSSSSQIINAINDLEYGKTDASQTTK